MDITTVVSLMVESAFHALTFLSLLRPNYQPAGRPGWLIAADWFRLVYVSQLNPITDLTGLYLVVTLFTLFKLWDLTEKGLRITFPYLDFES